MEDKIHNLKEQLAYERHMAAQSRRDGSDMAEIFETFAKDTEREIRRIERRNWINANIKCEN